MYGTEEEVGIAIKESGVPREQLFITNKVAQGIDDIEAAIDQSLQKIQTDYFDLCVFLLRAKLMTANATQIPDSPSLLRQVRRGFPARVEDDGGNPRVGQGAVDRSEQLHAPAP
jgi:hypothetical protein